MKHLTSYSSSVEKKSYLCSKAGELGSAIRWQGHVKKLTKQVRIYQYDYDIISLLSSVHGSISSVVSAALRAYCKCNHIKYSPPSWVD